MSSIKESFAKTQVKRGIAMVLSLTFLYKASEFMLRGTGLELIELDIWILCIFLIIANSSRKAFYFFAMPVVVLYTLYSPFGNVFGPPNYAYMVSIFGTDHLETKEFLSQIPTKFYTRAILIIPFVLLFRIITNKYNIQLHRNKTLLVLFVFLLIFLQKPFSIFHKGVDAYRSTFIEKKDLSKLIGGSSVVDVSLNADSDAQDFVLIIGESVRRDYMSVYGYEIDNTPFLSSMSSYVVNGMTSGAESTIASLRLMLTKPNKQEWAPNYHLNIVDLANVSGFETYWVSNQGLLGKHDTPVSVIATKSNNIFFLKKAGASSKNTSDFELLPYIKNTISSIEQEGKNRLFIIHLYGSHPDPCQRVLDFNTKQYTPLSTTHETIACYVASIHKTDVFINEVYKVLQENFISLDRPFSMIYFSDHGLAHLEEEGRLLLSHIRGRSPKQFQIPLIRIDSGLVAKKECDSFKSALNFTEGLATWMGIQGSILNPKYDLFDCKDDEDDYGLNKLLKAAVVLEDPPINIFAP